MYANIIYADKICKKKITEIKNVLIFLWKIYRWAKMQSNQWIVCGVYAYIIVSESQVVWELSFVGIILLLTLL